MDVVHADPASATDDLLAGWHEVRMAVEAELRPGEPALPLADTVAQVRHPGVEERHRLDVACDGAQVVGGLQTWWMELSNRHLVHVDVLVHPARRRRGVGTLLASHGAEVVRAAGRRTLLGAVPADQPGALEFARRQGFVLAPLRERRSVLRLASLDRDRLASLDRPAPGYGLLAWSGRCPDDLVEPFARAQNGMNDAPLDGLDVDDVAWTPAMVRAREDGWLERGLTVLVVAARHEASGELVALTELLASAHRPALAEQWNTTVLPAHRGHGLGLAVKAANLRRLLAHEPRCELVATWNATSNEHMLRVNTALGFTPSDEWVDAQLSL